MKKPTLRSLKKKAWKLFSEYVRRKDADEGGTVSCYTCERLLYWKHESQAGHAIPGRTNSVLFDASICRPQCYVCNCHRRGMHHIFSTKLIKENGIDWWEDKLSKAREVVKYTRADLEELIVNLKAKLESL